MNIDIKITEFHWSNLPGWPTRALLWKQHILSRDSRAASASVTKKNRFLEFPAKHNNIQHPFPTTSNYRELDLFTSTSVSCCLNHWSTRPSVGLDASKIPRPSPRHHFLPPADRPALQTPWKVCAVHWMWDTETAEAEMNELCWFIMGVTPKIVINYV